MTKSNSVDLTSGSVLKKLLVFAFPILIGNLLQQLYHLADVVVAGNYSADSTVALAAVGSTGQISTLILNLVSGLAVGANIIIAQRVGAKDREGVRRATDTAIIASFFCGAAMAVVGIALSRPLLRLMGSPATVIDDAVTYMRINFLAQPASMVFNFSSAILRAHGETLRPMKILSFTGLVNVFLNLLFVIVFHWDVAGVAWASLIANVLSAILILLILFHPEGDYRLSFGRMRFHKESFISIVKVGVPVGLNSIMFSLSNVIVTAAVNSLGAIAVAGVSAATSVCNLLHTVAHAFFGACVSFSGQNFGAGKLDRIDRLLWQSILLVDGIFILISTALTLSPAFFLGLFTKEESIILAGTPKLLINSWGYVIFVVAEMTNACQRGFGKSVTPTVINVVGICGARLIWVLLIFPHLEQNTTFLFLCYPISWAFSAAGQLVNYFIVRKKERRRRAQAM